MDKEIREIDRAIKQIEIYKKAGYTFAYSKTALRCLKFTKRVLEQDYKHIYAILLAEKDRNNEGLSELVENKHTSIGYIRQFIADSIIADLKDKYKEIK